MGQRGLILSHVAVFRGRCGPCGRVSTTEGSSIHHDYEKKNNASLVSNEIVTRQEYRNLALSNSTKEGRSNELQEGLADSE